MAIAAPCPAGAGAGMLIVGRDASGRTSRSAAGTMKGHRLP
jgi:hypothetical protein